jgi:hypothetical protein
MGGLRIRLGLEVSNMGGLRIRLRLDISKCIILKNYFNFLYKIGIGIRLEL